MKRNIIILLITLLATVCLAMNHNKPIPQEETVFNPNMCAMCDNSMQYIGMIDRLTCTDGLGEHLSSTVSILDTIYVSYSTKKKIYMCCKKTMWTYNLVREEIIKKLIESAKLLNETGEFNVE